MNLTQALEPLSETETSTQHQAYSEALQSRGLLQEAAERAAEILQKPSRTPPEQAFISECWSLMQPAPSPTSE